jgi:hypothetical protein
VEVQSALKTIVVQRLERMLGKSISQDIVDRFFRESQIRRFSFFSLKGVLPIQCSD